MLGQRNVACGLHRGCEMFGCASGQGQACNSLSKPSISWPGAIGRTGLAVAWGEPGSGWWGGWGGGGVGVQLSSHTRQYCHITISDYASHHCQVRHTVKQKITPSTTMCISVYRLNIRSEYSNKSKYSLSLYVYIFVQLIYDLII
jgi:hypothetical protein